MDPPPSVPWANATRPPAVAAAAPPDEPPASRPGVPWRDGGRSAGGLGVGREPELRGGGLAQADRARGAQQRRRVVVDVGHVVAEDRRAERRADTGGDGQVLDRRRHAQQRRRVTTCGQQVVRGLGGVERPVGGDGDERAEHVVERLDPAQVVLHELDSAQLTARHGGGLLQRAEVVRLGASGFTHRQGLHHARSGRQPLKIGPRITLRPGGGFSSACVLPVIRAITASTADLVPSSPPTQTSRWVSTPPGAAPAPESSTMR